MPSSMRAPRPSLKTDKAARRGAGRAPATAAAIRATPRPDTLTTPIPPRPGAVAMAAMVSRSTSSFRMRRFVAIEHALNRPLLKNGEDVVDQPIQHQSGRKKEQEDAEDEGHDLHDLGLHRIGRNGIHPGLKNHGHCHEDR